MSNVNNILVFVNGCFDVLHPGHVHLLREAASHGSKLVVGLNSDASVRRAKNRLARSFADRKTMLEACKYVDFVVSFSDITAIALVEMLRPSVYVTGEEYKGRSAEARLVKEYGGRVVYVPRLGDYSSSKEVSVEPS
jgi:D-beta-D-heptose 7-phosphate kinase / D-beta-D-heptose 1-phosphate adenosyltransferase